VVAFIEHVLFLATRNRCNAVVAFGGISNPEFVSFSSSAPSPNPEFSVPTQPYSTLGGNAVYR
jgi:hypothetical protein